MVDPIRDTALFRTKARMGTRNAVPIVKRGAVVVAGLALGLGGITLYRNHNQPSYQPHPASVRQFAFSTELPGEPPAPAAVAPPDVEPADAKAALVQALQTMADGKPQQAYSLLDAPSRKRFPTLTSWISAQANLVQPLTFEVGASRPAPAQADAVDFDVSATHRPSLDPFRGLVPARSQSVWEVRRENGAWRVGAEPMTFRPILPADASATPLVQSWLQHLVACDSAGAASLQVSGALYGPAGLVQAPCAKRGTWTAGAAEGLDGTPDPKAFLAAFGPEVGTWARLVPVQGPGASFLAAVAPMGDGWQVMGVAVGG